MVTESPSPAEGENPLAPSVETEINVPPVAEPPTETPEAAEAETSDDIRDNPEAFVEALENGQTLGPWVGAFTFGYGGREYTVPQGCQVRMEPKFNVIVEVA